MEQKEINLPVVYVVKTDFYSNFNSPIFIHADFDSALKQFSKLIQENYTFEQLLEPANKMHLDLEKGTFEFDIESSPDNIYIEEMFVNP